MPEGPEDGSPEWHAREASNYAKTGEAPAEQASPEFQARLQAQNAANAAEWAAFLASDPTWSNAQNLCATWMEQCAGDPFLYPGFDPFYDAEGVVEQVYFYDAGCARLSGRVWRPAGAQPDGALPTVVIETGSVQAPETLYWWFAQALVRQGYLVMTFDVRGQGRSEGQTPDGEQGSNANPAVFWDGLVNVVDFFRSSPANPYPHNAGCAAAHPEHQTPVNEHNPMHAYGDPSRLGLAGHSLGATGVSVVQGLDPWPGEIDTQNPVDVIVAWDSLTAGRDGAPDFSLRVPAMGHSSEYGLTPMPFEAAPDPEAHKADGFDAWAEAGLPAYQLTLQGSTHYEWSPIPTFPSTSWSYGRPIAEHYSVAWMDRWLKQPGEPGYDDADARLLADPDWVDQMSFYFRSARAFTDRDGVSQRCADIRAGCAAPAPIQADLGEPAGSPSEIDPAPASLPATGANAAARGFLGVTAAGLALALRHLGRLRRLAG